MIRFLLLGLLRDRHRSFFPILIVASGQDSVSYCSLGWMANSSIVDRTAYLKQGHIRIMTQA